MSQPKYQLNLPAVLIALVLFVVLMNATTAFVIYKIVAKPAAPANVVPEVNQLESIRKPHRIYLSSFFNTLAFEVANHPGDFGTIESCALLIKRSGEHVTDFKGFDYPGLPGLIQERLLTNVFGNSPIDRKLTSEDLSAFCDALSKLSADLGAL